MPADAALHPAHDVAPCSRRQSAATAPPLQEIDNGRRPPSQGDRRAQRVLQRLDVRIRGEKVDKVVNAHVPRPSARGAGGDEPVPCLWSRGQPGRNDYGCGCFRTTGSLLISGIRMLGPCFRLRCFTSFVIHASLNVHPSLSVVSSPGVPKHEAKFK